MPEVKTAHDQTTKVAKGMAPWRVWLLMLTALVLSALLVLGATSVYYLTGERYERAMTFSLDGSKLSMQSGEGVSLDQGLEITELHPGQRAIVAIPVPGIEASHYATMALATSNLTGRTRLELVWLDDRDRTRSLWLPPLSAGEAVISLSDHQSWEGPVHSLFLSFRAPLPEPVTIHRISLHPPPPTATEILGQIWTEWTAFEGRSAHSINSTFGGTRGALLPPAIAAAAWVLLGIAMYWLANLVLRVQRPVIVVFTVFFMVGWLMLDLRWQVDLLRHLETTKERFAGKSWEDKALAADDRDLFKVAHAVRDILGDEARDLSVIGSPRSLEGPYAFGRLRYHMVPHRLRRVWSTPPSTRELRRTDYLVLVPPFRGMRLDADASALIRPDGEMLPVEVIHSDPKLLVLRHAKVGERP